MSVGHAVTAEIAFAAVNHDTILFFLSEMYDLLDAKVMTQCEGRFSLEVKHLA